MTLQHCNPSKHSSRFYLRKPHIPQNGIKFNNINTSLNTLKHEAITTIVDMKIRKFKAFGTEKLSIKILNNIYFILGYIFFKVLISQANSQKKYESSYRYVSEYDCSVTHLSN